MEVAQSAIPVRLEERRAANGQRIGLATLSSPKTLNALSPEMIAALSPQLEQWAADPGIACVALQGEGEKAFCAGGDVKRMRAYLIESPGQRHPEAESFFSSEYRLDHQIHVFPKPLLCWGHGFVMGGGMGLMQGASHRVVTEASRLSMPEIVIGLYPDVGASWFLNRVPGRLGLFLGLTAAQINAADALFLGFADWLLPSHEREAMLGELLAVDWTDQPTTNHALLSGVLRRAQLRPERYPEAPIQQRFEQIRSLCLSDSLEHFGSRLQQLAKEDPWYAKPAATFAAGSPTSAHLIWHLHRRRSHLSLGQAFEQELVLSCQCGMHPDFAEGIRALLVDKDNQPQWTPDRLDAVTEAWIQEHFTAPWGDDGPKLFD
jgi:enoyl-CoA hydratase/carnithine racemase